MKKKLRDITVEELLAGKVKDSHKILSALDGYATYNIAIEECGYSLDDEFEIIEK